MLSFWIVLSIFHIIPVVFDSKFFLQYLNNPEVVYRVGTNENTFSIQDHKIPMIKYVSKIQKREDIILLSLNKIYYKNLLGEWPEGIILR